MDLFKQYKPNVKFNIRLLGKKAFSIKDVKEIKDNYYENSNKVSDIYFRPQDHNFIMVDFDGEQPDNTLTRLKKNNSFLIIQTSKNRFQAWFYCKYCDTAELYKQYSRYLVDKYPGSDIGAAKSGQIGRLPGYINHKKGRNKYRTKVIYRNTELPILKKVVFSSSSSQGKLPPKKPNNNNNNNNDNVSEFNKRRDWGFMNMILENNPNHTRQDLINILASQSENGNDLSYVINTVDNLLNYRNNS